MTMANTEHWSDRLQLREEVVDQHGQLVDLQMSLYAAAYHTRPVLYRHTAYYGEITAPTPGLVGFMADIARRLGTTATMVALYHLDQGMGGGKSHALTGLWHMASNPGEFFATEIGIAVREEAEQRANGPIDLAGTRVVVLSADNMTPGKTSPEFGPASTLHERFLWSLFDGDDKAYRKAVAEGPNKAALARALTAVGAPVLILLDELMDYALALSSEEHVAGMPSEQGFLSALMDAADDVTRVAFVVVMIRSDLDERGYNERAEEFRDYVARRIERNGVTASVTDAQDFSLIIRRRLFETFDPGPLAASLAARWAGEATKPWIDNVFDKLASNRSLAGFRERLERTYPFHPDLMALVRDDWSQHAGFQRVRSTVAIFAGTAYHWFSEHRTGRWSPELIGVGDVPLHRTIEEVLSSGLLHGNDKAMQGFRQVAAADIVAKDGTHGRAVELDARYSQTHPHLAGVQPGACVRMATALFMYSLVPRAQARRGATKAELLAAVYVPTRAFGYADADEALGQLVHEDEGLGALDTIKGSGGNVPTRYVLTVTQNLRMFFRQAKGTVTADLRDAFMWERVQEIATKGPFNRLVFIDAPGKDSTPLEGLFGDVDESTSNRLVVLDLRRWALLNGRDTSTRSEIEALLGSGPMGLHVDNAASVVVACVNTQRRETARKRAVDALAYRAAGKLLAPEDELRTAADDQFRALRKRLDEDLRRAFQHYAYVVWTTNGVEVDFRRFDSEAETALSGRCLWDALVKANRAAQAGTLGGEFLRAVLDVTERAYTLREVVQKFWQDPRFPLVPSISDVRRAIFEAITTPDGWEIAGETGEVLSIPGPDSLAINSVKQVVRPAAPVSVIDDVDGAGGGDDKGGDGGGTDGDGDQETVYKRYSFVLPTKSLTQPDLRKKVWHLLSTLADAADPQSGKDIQLIELDVTVTAAEGSVAELEAKGMGLGVKWVVADEEF